MMKKVGICVLLLALCAFSVFLCEAETNDLVEMPSANAWPCESLFSETYVSISGNNYTYRFTKRPDGSIGLRYANTTYDWGGEYVLSTGVSANAAGDVELINDGGLMIGTLRADGALEIPGDTLMRIPGGEYWPAWKYNIELTNDNAPEDVIGAAVHAVILEKGRYQIGDGQSEEEGLYYIKENCSPVKMADESAESGFCVLDGWFYLSAGRVDAAGNYVAYLENEICDWDSLQLVGMTRDRLIFCNRYWGSVIATAPDGSNATVLFELPRDETPYGAAFSYVSMDEYTVCCQCHRFPRENDEEYTTLLIDIATGEAQFLNGLSLYEEEKSSTNHRDQYYSVWSEIQNGIVLFFNYGEDENIRYFSVTSPLTEGTPVTGQIMHNSELDVKNCLFYSLEPICTVIDGWLYHLYQYDDHMIVRTRLDGSVLSEHVATIDSKVNALENVAGELVVGYGSGNFGSCTDYMKISQ